MRHNWNDHVVWILCLQVPQNSRLTMNCYLPDIIMQNDWQPMDIIDLHLT